VYRITECVLLEVYTPRKWQQHRGRQCDVFALVEGLPSRTEYVLLPPPRSRMRASLEHRTCSRATLLSKSASLARRRFGVPSRKEGLRWCEKLVLLFRLFLA